MVKEVKGLQELKGRRKETFTTQMGREIVGRYRIWDQVLDQDWERKYRRMTGVRTLTTVTTKEKGHQDR